MSKRECTCDTPTVTAISHPSLKGVCVECGHPIHGNPSTESETIVCPTCDGAEPVDECPVCNETRFRGTGKGTKPPLNRDKGAQNGITPPDTEDNGIEEGRYETWDCQCGATNYANDPSLFVYDICTLCGGVHKLYHAPHVLEKVWQEKAYGANGVVTTPPPPSTGRESPPSELTRTKPEPLVQDTDETARNVEDCPVVERLEAKAYRFTRTGNIWEVCIADPTSATHPPAENVQALCKREDALTLIHDLQAERDGLREDYEELDGQWFDMAQWCIGAKRGRDELKAENARLREAIRAMFTERYGVQPPEKWEWAAQGKEKMLARLLPEHKHYGYETEALTGEHKTATPLPDCDANRPQGGG